MYLALFLSPWIFMYALSTIAMNHRDHLRGGPPEFRIESETPYTGSFSAGISPPEAATLLLRDLDMDGTHNAKREAGGKLVINRVDPVHPKRITYDPARQTIVVEALQFRLPAFLERMHRRRGFQHDYTLEDSWAFSVDLFIAAMMFWVISGLWMWWEMRVTRGLGAVFAVSGIALCGLFLLTI
jgi:hypothetical protein